MARTVTVILAGFDTSFFMGCANAMKVEAKHLSIHLQQCSVPEEAIKILRELQYFEVGFDSDKRRATLSRSLGSLAHSDKRWLRLLRRWAQLFPQPSGQTAYAPDAFMLNNVLIPDDLIRLRNRGGDLVFRSLRSYLVVHHLLDSQ